MNSSREFQRLSDHRHRKTNWKNWGPYLSERSWATVREERNGFDPWQSFTHDEARSKVFRWGEDGIAGISDRLQMICFSFALWNGKDPILKERLFGLSGKEGNHGEDVKECYYYLDSTPTHSYMRMLYKYPHGPFPYEQLVRENQKRGRGEKEFELLDTPIFDQNNYFDLTIEYAKAEEEDILIRAKAINRGEKAEITLLPTLWFRNIWSWGYKQGPTGDEKGRPSLSLLEQKDQWKSVKLSSPSTGDYILYAEGASELLVTENDANTAYKKDAFHRYFIGRDTAGVNPKKEGTKCCFVYKVVLEKGEEREIRLRLSQKVLDDPFKETAPLFDLRMREADEFYGSIQNAKLPPELLQIQRQAFAGMLWSKQFYYLDQYQWRIGDPLLPKKGEQRNRDWDHLVAYDILSMPDKWEYPYFCSWDSAFHTLTLVMVDPDFAKRQLLLMTREWYMHPNGQLPAYEWSFSDVNPPVHAWAAWRTYKIDAKMYGEADRPFLEGIFHKLLLNFTWWINRKDIEGRNIFQGGFLGMDNISVFDRSRSIPGGGRIDQSDGSSWMAFYSILMMKIALHLAEKEPVYQDMATKFFEHFLRISSAMNNCGGSGQGLWDREDQFYYDVLHLPDNRVVVLKVRSLVGLLPLLAVETLESSTVQQNPDFMRRLEWFIHKKSDVGFNLSCVFHEGEGKRRLLSIPTQQQLIAVLGYLLDEKEFLAPFGIRSLSKFHAEHPYHLAVDGTHYEVRYNPGESEVSLFGGNSNWRGPIWFPINFLIIEALQKYHHYYGDTLKVECPKGSGVWMNLWQVSEELSKRLMRLFVKNKEGQRPIFGASKRLQEDPHFSEHLLFHEYFHPETGEGLGASHQTGWTGLIAKLIQQSGELL